MSTESKFINLHVHTHYSLLESTVKIPKLIESAKEMQMDALAVTDLGNMEKSAWILEKKVKIGFDKATWEFIKPENKK